MFAYKKNIQCLALIINILIAGYAFAERPEDSDYPRKGQGSPQMARLSFEAIALSEDLCQSSKLIDGMKV